MKFIAALSSLVLLSTLSFAEQTVNVAFDPVYDFNSSTPVENLACPPSSIPLNLDGVSTVHDLLSSINFAHPITALPNSIFDNGEKCGTCWKLTASNPGTGDSPSNTFLAVDQATSEHFVISKEVLDTLRGGGVLLGGPGLVNIPAVQVDCPVFPQ